MTALYTPYLLEPFALPGTHSVLIRAVRDQSISPPSFLRPTATEPLLHTQHTPPYPNVPSLNSLQLSSSISLHSFSHKKVNKDARYPRRPLWCRLGRESLSIRSAFAAGAQSRSCGKKEGWEGKEGRVIGRLRAKGILWCIWTMQRCSSAVEEVEGVAGRGIRPRISVQMHKEIGEADITRPALPRLPAPTLPPSPVCPAPFIHSHPHRM